PPSCRGRQLREGDTEVLDREAAWPAEHGVREAAERAPGGEADPEWQRADQVADATEAARQQRVARPARRATEPPPYRAARHQERDPRFSAREARGRAKRAGSEDPPGFARRGEGWNPSRRLDDAGSEEVVQVENARGAPRAVGEDEQRRDRVPLHERHRLRGERAAGDRLRRRGPQVAGAELARVGGALERATEIAVGDHAAELSRRAEHAGETEARGGDLDEGLFEGRVLADEGHGVSAVHQVLDPREAPPERAARMEP